MSDVPVSSLLVHISHMHVDPRDGFIDIRGGGSGAAIIHMGQSSNKIGLEWTRFASV